MREPPHAAGHDADGAAALLGDRRSPLLGPVPPLVYVAMFAGTIAGQMLGMALDAALRAVSGGGRHLWLPLACSATFEAVLGARLGAARLGRPLSPGECARVSLLYSAALGALSLPLLLWSLAVIRSKAGLAGAPSPGAALALLVVALASVTAVRAALMVPIARARGRR
ncbi:MAG: hypothetical protein JOZ69_16550 [Myxococcales bacterium]|nr:hypothetical protein [Myxococcales bacterium]